jgi:alpha-1,3-rhamnosyl/mannosyltransferase
MRVLVNSLTAAGVRTGIGHYTHELLRCLRGLAGPGEITTFPGPLLRGARALAGRAQTWLPRRRGGTAPDGGTARPGRATHWLRSRADHLLARSFEHACRAHVPDLYHEPNFIPLPGDVPTLATFPDLSVLLHPQWHPADRVTHHERHFHRAVGRCVHILAISEHARGEIVRTLGVPASRVTRTYMGVRAGLGPLPPKEVKAGLARLGLPREYLLCLGTIEPRKNVLTLLRAYCELPWEVRERFPLVLVGGWGWGVGPVAEYLDREARYKGVRHLGYVADRHLGLLYNGARALAFPSFYEGFGLPPVEMLACGGAVLASTAGAVAETAGAAAHLIDPRDEVGWHDALLSVCTDDEWWSVLRRGAVEAARPFTWEQCAADTLRVYRQLAGRVALRAAA